MFTLKAVSCVASHRGAASGVNESFYAFTVLHSLSYNTAWHRLHSVFSSSSRYLLTYGIYGYNDNISYLWCKQNGCFDTYVAVTLVTII